MSYNNESILTFENKGRNMIIHLNGEIENVVYYGERTGKLGGYYIFFSANKNDFLIKKDTVNNMLIEINE